MSVLSWIDVRGDECNVANNCTISSSPPVVSTNSLIIPTNLIRTSTTYVTETNLRYSVDIRDTRRVLVRTWRPHIPSKRSRSMNYWTGAT